MANALHRPHHIKAAIAKAGVGEIRQAKHGAHRNVILVRHSVRDVDLIRFDANAMAASAAIYGQPNRRTTPAAARVLILLVTALIEARPRTLTSALTSTLTLRPHLPASPSKAVAAHGLELAWIGTAAAGLGSITIDGVSHLSREIAIFEVRVRTS